MQVKPFLATKRDLGLLAELGELGLLTGEMLAARHFRGFSDAQSAQRSFRRRMKLFRTHGLVQVTRVPTTGYGGGRIISICRLTEEGATLVMELTGSRPRRAGTSQAINPITVPHRLGAVETRLAFDDAHQELGLPRPEWVFEYDLRPGADPMASNDDKFILYESFKKSGKRLVCWPDAAVRIRLGGQPPHELLAYIEYDRSTETSRQLAAKSEPYQLLVREHRYANHWNGLAERHLLRVLFIGRSKERLRHAIEAIRGTPGEPLFRFATYEEVSVASVMTEPIWRTVDGDRLAILKSSSL